MRESESYQQAGNIMNVLTSERFNAIAFYLDIADMLSKEGL